MRGHGHTRSALFFALLDMRDTPSANDIAHGLRQHHRDSRLNFCWVPLHCGNFDAQHFSHPPAPAHDIGRACRMSHTSMMPTGHEIAACEINPARRSASAELACAFRITRTTSAQGGMRVRCPESTGCARRTPGLCPQHRNTLISESSCHASCLISDECPSNAQAVP